MWDRTPIHFRLIVTLPRTPHPLGHPSVGMGVRVRAHDTIVYLTLFDTPEANEGATKWR